MEGGNKKGNMEEGMEEGLEGVGEGEGRRLLEGGRVEEKERYQVSL